MFEEDYPTPGLRSQTEHYVLLQLSAMGIVSSWAMGGGVSWVIGYLAALGILTPIIVEGHRRHGHFNFFHPLRRFLLALLPVWVALAVFCLGLLWKPTQFLLLGEQAFVALKETPWWAPATSTPTQSWLTLLYLIAVYMAGIGLAFVTLTTSLIRRLLLILALNAFALSLFGYVQLYAGGREIFWYFRPVVSFFSTFTHAHHYASFALMWSIVLFGLILHLRRQTDTKAFLARWGIMMLAAWAILASSVIVTGTALQQGMLALATGWCLITEAAHTGSQGRRGKQALGILAGLLLALPGIAWPAYSLMEGDSLTGIPWVVQSELWRNAWALFLEKPIFGWGIGSFQTVFALNGSVNLPFQSVLTPHSDLLHLLVEQGLVGLLVWTLPILIFMVRFVQEPAKRLFSAHLWVAILITLLMAVLAFPLQNPACLFSFWVLLGAADAWPRVQFKESKLETRFVFDHDEMSRVQKLERPRGSTRSKLEMRNWFK